MVSVNLIEYFVKKGKNFILEVHHFKYADWIYWFHIQRKRMSNVNMYVLKINFEGYFVLMSLQVFLAL